MQDSRLDTDTTLCRNPALCQNGWTYRQNSFIPIMAHYSFVKTIRCRKIPSASPSLIQVWITTCTLSANHRSSQRNRVNLLRGSRKILYKLIMVWVVLESSRTSLASRIPADIFKRLALVLVMVFKSFTLPWDLYPWLLVDTVDLTQSREELAQFSRWCRPVVSWRSLKQDVTSLRCWS